MRSSWLAPLCSKLPSLSTFITDIRKGLIETGLDSVELLDSGDIEVYAQISALSVSSVCSLFPFPLSLFRQLHELRFYLQFRYSEIISMDEIIWSGWLQKRGGDSTGIVKGLGFMGITGNKERFFVLKRRSLTYYAPPSQTSRGSIFIESPTPKALTDLGFVKKGSVELDEVLHMKKSEVDRSLQLVTTSGRIYEVSSFDDVASNLDMTSFEGCLHNLGIKMEVDMSSIYEVKLTSPMTGPGRLLINVFFFFHYKGPRKGYV